MILLLTYLTLGAICLADDFGAPTPEENSGLIVGNCIAWDNGATSLNVGNVTVSSDYSYALKVGDYILSSSSLKTPEDLSNP